MAGSRDTGAPAACRAQRQKREDGGAPGYGSPGRVPRSGKKQTLDR
ncbi:MAG: hypothetical protein Fur005_40130 [Roseiflexaceae bacterium]